MDYAENWLADTRRRGLRIIRYSETEAKVPGTLGRDALIRFAKDPSEYSGWTGETETVLNFTGGFAARYPDEAHTFNILSERVPCVTAGSGSDQNFANGLGFTTHEQQKALFRTHRAYVYLAGLSIPYTLNFIEAWMTGTPMIVLAPPDRVGPYLEIDHLVEDGQTGFVCRDVDAAATRARQLLDDPHLAARISGAGRRRAIELFGAGAIKQQWADLLTSVGR